MKNLTEHRIHEIFQLSVLLKGAHAVLECASGLALAFASTSSIVDTMAWLTQDELIEDPNDFVATNLLRMAQDFSVTTKNFYVFYLLSHGIVKLFLVAALLRKQILGLPGFADRLGAFHRLPGLPLQLHPLDRIGSPHGL